MRRAVAAWAAFLVLVCAVTPAVAEDPRYTREEILAGYLLRFASFARWPASSPLGSDEPFVIGVFGEEKLAEALQEALSQDRIDEHPLRTRLVDDTGDLEGLRMLFVSETQAAKAGAVMKALDGSAVLTVSDAAQFARCGGMIELTLVEKKWRFRLNLTAARSGSIGFRSHFKHGAVERLERVDDCGP